MKRVLAFSIATIFFFCAGSAFACIHGPEGLQVRQNKFRVLLSHANGKQTIVIQPNVGVDKKTTVGWVFPVPELPSKIDVVGQNRLKDIAQHYFPPGKKKSKGRSKGGSGKVIVHKTIKVGPFTITPIEGGYKGVNKWLSKNGFSSIPKDHLVPYLERGWVLLAAKIALSPTKKGKKTEASNAPTIVSLDGKAMPSKAKGTTNSTDVPPIFLQFKSDEIVFPWMFERTTSKKTNFDFMVFTEKKFSDDELVRIQKEHSADIPAPHWVRRSEKTMIPKSQKKFFRKLGFKGKSVHAMRMSTRAVSHKEAIEKDAPDLALKIP